MHIDARKLENNSQIEGDICIIGAGAAGISIALDWMDISKNVILLEGGGFEYDDKVQDSYGGRTTGQKYYPLKSSRLHYFGGTTGHWAGLCSPMDDVDFKKRDWVPDSGWPINKKDLDPFYEKAHEILLLGPYNYEFDYWRSQLPDLKPFPFDDKVIWNKMWQFSQARFGQLYKETVIKSQNIHLYTYANAVNIKANDNVTSINEVIVKNLEGKTHTVRAKKFIMACGSIQNARMLLASNTRTPAGLGNDNDLVGRYFMEHLEVASAEFWLFKPFPMDLYIRRYGETKASAELAITEAAQAEHKILNGTASFSRLSYARHTKSRMDTWQDEDPRKSMENLIKNFNEAAAKAKKDNTGSISHAFELSTRIEQAPNPNSRITLDAEKDGFGIPRTHLHWELTSLEKRSVRTIYKLLGQHAGITGMGRIKLNEFLRDENDDSFPESTYGGWHHMGTTRMNDDPKKGVVDANCKVHGIDNLYIAGAACYATSAAPNPTLTLVALTLRLSDHLKSFV